MKPQSSRALHWSFAAVLLLPIGGDAQTSPLSSVPLPVASPESAHLSSQVRSPAMSWPTLAVPSIRTDQERRLPVYDDAGELIPFGDIRARVDPSGFRGAFWGALVGSALGSGIAALTSGCGEVEGGLQHYCSPRGKALKERLPVGLGITFGVLGAWIGYSTDHTSFDEAISQIRYERRVGR